MRLLDAVWLIGTAAVGLGMFQWARRGLFQGWIWILQQGFPDPATWTSLHAMVLCSDLMVFLIPIVAPWTLLAMLLRAAGPRRPWRLVWRQPGMAACLAVVAAWIWSALGLLAAMSFDRIARPRRVVTADLWARKYLADEVFMYVGLAVACTWLMMWITGRWRRPTDWIDRLGLGVGVAWIGIGFTWTFREYLEFL